MVKFERDGRDVGIKGRAPLLPRCAYYVLMLYTLIHTAASRIDSIRKRTSGGGAESWNVWAGWRDLGEAARLWCCVYRSYCCSIATGRRRS